MESSEGDEPASDIDLAELTGDIRGVAVLWKNGDAPEIELLGECNPYEAIGLLRLAFRKLEDEYALEIEEEDEDGNPV